MWPRINKMHETKNTSVKCFCVNNFTFEYKAHLYQLSRWAAEQISMLLLSTGNSFGRCYGCPINDSPGVGQVVEQCLPHIKGDTISYADCEI